MGCTSWPAPPVGKYAEPPEIPERFSVFGTTYRVEGGSPVVDLPNAPLNRAEIEESINSSFSAFVSFMETADTDCLNEIGELHTAMNEAINKAKGLMNEEVFAMCKAMSIQRKKAVMDEMKKLMK